MSRELFVVKPDLISCLIYKHLLVNAFYSQTQILVDFLLSHLIGISRRFTAIFTAEQLIFDC